VVRGGFAKDTADRIVTLLGDAELRRRMGERGREWIEEKWRWDLLAEKLKDLL
jgi:phosphatidylinositol alpha-1,6-mannosyltransferase